MHKASIIGVAGFAGSGKDTVSDYLVNNHDFVKLAMADAIKRFGYHVFLFSEKQLWGPSSYRNSVDKRFENQSMWDETYGRLVAFGPQFVATVLGTDDKEDISAAYSSLTHWFIWLEKNHRHDLSPRRMAQTLGTEWGRDSVSQDVWANLTLRTAKTILNEDGNEFYWDYDPLDGLTKVSANTVRGVVISDVRFTNEILAIKNVGGSIIKLVRPGVDSVHIGITNHVSETELEELSLDLFDFIIQNDKSIDDLQQCIDTYVKMFRLSHT